MNDVALQTLTEQERYWLGHIQQAQVSNQSLTQYAQAHALNLKGFYNYRSKLRKKGFLDPKPITSFVKVSTSVTSRLSDTVIMLPNGIRIQTECQPDTLVELVKRLA